MARNIKPLFLNILVLVTLLGGLFSSSTPVFAAAPILVTITADEMLDPAVPANQFIVGAGCSLREAIYSANNDISWGGCVADSGVDIIIVPAGHYFLSLAVDAYQNSKDANDDGVGALGDLDIYSPMTIVGSGTDDVTGTVITGVDPNNASTKINTRILEVFGGPALSPVSVNLQHLKLTGGYAFAVNEETEFEGVGGGIYNNRGLLNLFDVVIDSNKAFTSGGGFYNAGGYNKMNIFESIVSNNITEKREGGGILSKGMLWIQNSLIDGNEAQGPYINAKGGGLMYQGTADSRLVNVTITHNTSTGAGAGLYAEEALQIINTTIAYNNVQKTTTTPTNAALELSGASQSVVMNTLVTGNIVVGTTTVANCNFPKQPQGKTNLFDNAASGCGGNTSNGFSASSAINLSASLDYYESLYSYTKGYKLETNSKAIDTGTMSFASSVTKVTYYCPGSDYRWAIRPMKGTSAGGCDIGAYEANNYETGLPEFYKPVRLPLINR
jgi:CSLREA domain-containing protein